MSLLSPVKARVAGRDAGWDVIPRACLRYQTEPLDCLSFATGAKHTNDRISKLLELQRLLRYLLIFRVCLSNWTTLRHWDALLISFWYRRNQAKFLSSAILMPSAPKTR